MTNPNDSAYPETERQAVKEYGQETWVDVVRGGLTKREYFAAMAMESCIKYASIVAPQVRFKDCAELAVQHADALIAELNKEVKP